MTTYPDNIRVGASSPQPVLTDRVRESTANPPLFHWPMLDTASQQRLQ